VRRSRAVPLLRRSLRAARLEIGARALDRLHGVETARPLDLTTIGLADEHRVEYDPSAWRDLRRALPRAEVSADDVLLDLGSGKGRIVLQAAQYHFKRVIGVELSPQLNAIAAANVHAAHKRLRCRSIELVTADALEYHIPDDVTVVYMYNPFRGPVFRAVIEELIASVDRAPRSIRLLYKAPREHELLMSTGRFELVRTVSAWRPTRAWAQLTAINVYIVTPARIARTTTGGDPDSMPATLRGGPSGGRSAARRGRRNRGWTGA